MRVPPLAVAATLVALTAPVAAQANRAPTKTERARIARAADAPARCLLTYVSTVDSRWASITVDHDAGRACQRLGDGTQFYRRSGKRYVSQAGSSDCTRPRVVPLRIWRDLKPYYCQR
jgi:hypothetical protein